MEKKIEYYLNLPYTIELRGNPEEGWFVRVRELPGCMSEGDTPEEAVSMIREAMELWLEVALEEGDAIPEPRTEDEYSGKFVVRVPRSLHRELVGTADREGVSLNQYINVALAEATGKRSVTIAPPRAVEDPGWPGLKSTLASILARAGCQEDAGIIDERLFSDWLENQLGQVAAAAEDRDAAEAIAYLDTVERVLADSGRRSPVIAVFTRAMEIMRDQIELCHNLERELIDRVRIEHQVTQRASNFNRSRVLVQRRSSVVYSFDPILQARQEASNLLRSPEGRVDSESL